MAATIDGNSIEFLEGGITSKVNGLAYKIGSNSSFVFTPKTTSPYLVFYSNSNTMHALYKVYSGGKVRLLGNSNCDQYITHDGYTITIRNPQSWVIPVYILSL